MRTVIWRRIHGFKTRRFLLGVFAKLRKGTINFIMSVSPSVRSSVRPSARKTRLPLDEFP